MMPTGKRISSRNTYFLKRVFPILWVGILGLFVATAFSSARNARPPLIIFIVPVLCGPDQSPAHHTHAARARSLRPGSDLLATAGLLRPALPHQSAGERTY
jgi:hypothetical protein